MRSYFYNDFVSGVFFEPEYRDTSAISLCVERLADVAFVEIRMTNHHAIVITRSTRKSLAATTAVIGWEISFQFSCSQMSRKAILKTVCQAAAF